MAKRKRQQKIYHKYQCSLTGETFTRTRKAENPEELVSVRAFYELNPDKDDRPEVIKKQVATISDDELSTGDDAEEEQ